MKIHDAMTRNPEIVHANDPIRKAAELMKDLNVGAVPVFEGDDAIGIITDRDIAIRVVATGKDPATRVKECMTKNVVVCPEDADLHDALQVMKDRKIRRLLVKDRYPVLFTLASSSQGAGTGEHFFLLPPEEEYGRP